MFTDVPRVVHASLLPDSELPLEPLGAEQVVSGDPEVRHLALHDAADLALGIWQHGVGVSTDVEADEVFVVLSGRATIDIADGPTIEVGPGDVCLLPAGGSAVWTIHETLRKVYVIRP